MPGYLDIDLINDFNNGYKKAFDELYNRYYSMIYVFCFKLTGQKEESQDITMETINILFRKYKDFDSLPNIKAFLYITARNRCMDYFRYMQRITDGRNRLITTLSEEDEANDILNVEFLLAVRKSMELLSRRQREVIELLYLSEEKYKYKEVAEKMNISVKAVEKYRSLGLAYLRELLPASRTADSVALLGFLITIFM